MSLHSKALLVTLSIGMPPMSKTLKEKSIDLEIQHRTEPNQAAVVSKLFAKSDIKDLQNAAARARQYFKVKTLPFGRAMGIIPASQYFNFLQEMGNFRLDFESAKEDIIKNIEDILRNAEAANGTLFNKEHYPAVWELEENIFFKITCQPVPAANDYDKLADLTPEEIETLKREAVLDTQSKLESAVKDLFGRLLKGLIHAAERLGDEDKVFHASLIGNIHKAIDSAETLNIDDNAELKKFTDAVKELFDGISASDLRTDSKLRKETAEKASDLAQKMSELF